MEGLHHVEINVSDLSKSAEFWGWLLGFLGYELYQCWDEGRSWRRGDHYLVFVQAEPAHVDGGYHRKRPGLNHLAFRARSPDQVRELPALLEERGVQILYRDREAGQVGAPSDYSVFFEDPDRIKIEVITPEAVL